MPTKTSSHENRADVGIDVAIPCYQYGHLLRECVESLLAQGLPALRVLIIDNASTDDSLEVAQQLAAESPSVEVAAHPRNLGPHASFNEAVDWAAQKYFLLLCADDMSAPGALARAITVLEQHPQAVLSYGPAALLGANELSPTQRSVRTYPDLPADASWRVFPGEDLLERFCGSGVCTIAGCTAVVRTEAQKQVGYYRESLPHTDDFEMWMRFARVGHVAETSAVQGIMRDHALCQSAFVRLQHRWDILHCEDAFESFFAHEGSSLPNPRRLHRLARKSLGARAYWSAVAHLTRGDFAEALEIFRIAVRIRPGAAVLPPVSYLLRRRDTLARVKGTLSQALPASRKRGETLGAEA